MWSRSGSGETLWPSSAKSAFERKMGTDFSFIRPYCDRTRFNAFKPKVGLSD